MSLLGLGYKTTRAFSRASSLSLSLSLSEGSQLPYCEYPLEGPLWQGTDVSSQQPARTVGLVNELGSRSSHTQALI